jgi:hypothetical protein
VTGVPLVIDWLATPATRRARRRQAARLLLAAAALIPFVVGLVWRLQRSTPPGLPAQAAARDCMR